MSASVTVTITPFKNKKGIPVYHVEIDYTDATGKEEKIDFKSEHALSVINQINDTLRDAFTINLARLPGSTAEKPTELPDEPEPPAEPAAAAPAPEPVNA